MESRIKDKHQETNFEMKRNILTFLIIAGSFVTGFAFKTLLINQNNKSVNMKKVTGIGGIFFKCKDPKKVNEWYSKNLGLNTNPYGAVFEWYQGADSTRKGFTTWSPFKESTHYFEPSEKDFMINYRVENLEALLKELKENEVTILDTIETYDYGKFVHILDIEGNKVELWEPNDLAYEKMGKEMGSETTK
ncbi:MAG: Glyoxalase-like domain protein [Bacteroidetes bacterium ADurb.Bin408]|nr:MAG: Glyoxalase-like domain protein [Bacteroidetes bacterium ADurb.Bin408]